MDDKKLTQYTRQRQAIRLNCNNKAQKVTAFFDPATDIAVEDLQTSLGKLKYYRERLLVFNGDILLGIEIENDADTEASRASDFDVVLLEYIVELSVKIDNLRAAAAANISAAGDHHSTSRQSFGESRAVTVQLSKLNKIKFDGIP